MLRPETAERMLGPSRSFAPVTYAPPRNEVEQEIEDDETIDEEPMAAEAVHNAAPAPVRRNERRPPAPRRRDVQEGGGKRYLIIGVIAALVLGGGAGAVMLLPGSGDGPTLQPPAPVAPTTTTTLQETPKPVPAGKNSERLGDPLKPAENPAPAPEKPVALGTGPAEPQTPPTEDKTPAAQPATPQPKPLVAPQEAAVAQKAMLLEEQPDQPGQGKFYQGSTTWRTQSVSGGANAALETAIVGEVDIPERKLKVILTLRRNADPALPATHTLQIQFAVPADFPNAGVQDIANVLPKPSAQQPGVPLTGGKVKVTNGVFLIGLQDAPPDRGRNLQLLRERGWFDVPILYDNGRRAILTLEKGVPGERVFEEAFAAWNAAAQATQPQ